MMWVLALSLFLEMFLMKRTFPLRMILISNPHLTLIQQQLPLRLLNKMICPLIKLLISPHSSTHKWQPFTTHQLEKVIKKSKMPSYLADYHCSLQSESTPLKTPTAPHHLSNVDSYSYLSPIHQALSVGITIDFDPRSYFDAIKYHCWRDAINSEIKALQDNSTSDMTSLPPNEKAIGSKWIFRIKYNSERSINKNKARSQQARLVAKEDTQQGVDHIETFPPIAKMATLRILLSIAAAHRWPLQQLKMKNDPWGFEMKQCIWNSQEVFKAPFSLKIKLPQP